MYIHVLRQMPACTYTSTYTYIYAYTHKHTNTHTVHMYIHTLYPYTFTHALAQTDIVHALRFVAFCLRRCFAMFGDLGEDARHVHASVLSVLQTRASMSSAERHALIRSLAWWIIYTYVYLYIFLLRDSWLRPSWGLCRAGPSMLDLGQYSKGLTDPFDDGRRPQVFFFTSSWVKEAFKGWSSNSALCVLIKNIQTVSVTVILTVTWHDVVPRCASTWFAPSQCCCHVHAYTISHTKRNV